MISGELLAALENGRLCVLVGEDAAALSGIPTWRELHMMALDALSAQLQETVPGANLRAIAEPLNTDQLAAIVRDASLRMSFIRDFASVELGEPTEVYAALSTLAQAEKLRAVFTPNHDGMIEDDEVFDVLTLKEPFVNDYGVPLFKPGSSLFLSEGLGPEIERNVDLRRGIFRKQWAPFLDGATLLVIGLSRDDLDHYFVKDILAEAKRNGGKVWWVHDSEIQPPKDVTSIRADLSEFCLALLAHAVPENSAPHVRREGVSSAIASHIDDWANDKFGPQRATCVLLEIVASEWVTNENLPTSTLLLLALNTLKSIDRGGEADLGFGFRTLAAGARLFWEKGALEDARIFARRAQLLVESRMEGRDVPDDIAEQLLANDVLYRYCSLIHAHSDDWGPSDEAIRSSLRIAHSKGDFKSYLGTLSDFIDTYLSQLQEAALPLITNAANFANDCGYVRECIQLRIQQARCHIARGELCLAEQLLESLGSRINGYVDSQTLRINIELLTALTAIQNGRLETGLKQLVALAAQTPVRGGPSRMVAEQLSSLGVQGPAPLFKGITLAEVNAFMKGFDPEHYSLSTVANLTGKEWSARSLPFTTGLTTSGPNKLNSINVLMAEFNGDVESTIKFALDYAMGLDVSLYATEALAVAENALCLPADDRPERMLFLGIAGSAHAWRGEIELASKRFREMGALQDSLGEVVPEALLEQVIVHWVQVGDKEELKKWTTRAKQTFEANKLDVLGATKLVRSVSAIDSEFGETLLRELRDYIGPEYLPQLLTSTPYAIGVGRNGLDLDDETMKNKKAIEEMLDRGEFPSILRMFQQTMALPVTPNLPFFKCTLQATIANLSPTRPLHQTSGITDTIREIALGNQNYDALLYLEMAKIRRAISEMDMSYALSLLRTNALVAHLAQDARARAEFNSWSQLFNVAASPLADSFSAQYFNLPHGSEVRLSETAAEAYANFETALGQDNPYALIEPLDDIKASFQPDAPHQYGMLVEVYRAAAAWFVQNDNPDYATGLFTLLAISETACGHSASATQNHIDLMRLATAENQFDEIFRWVLPSREACGSRSERSDLQRTIALCYLNQEGDSQHFQDAEVFADGALSDAEQDTEQEGFAYVVKARVAAQLGKSEDALAYFEDGLAILEDKKSPSAVLVASKRDQLLESGFWTPHGPL